MPRACLKVYHGFIIRSKRDWFKNAVKLKDDFSRTTVYVGSFLAVRNLFCYRFKNKWFVRNDKSANEYCA